MIRTIERQNCPSCGAQQKPLYQGLSDRIFGTSGVWNLSQCSNRGCQLAWLNPMPLEAEIEKAYAQYYTHAPNQTDSPDSGVSTFKTIQQGYAKLIGCAAQRAAMENYFLAGESAGSVLEIGSGNGSRLKRLTDLGWQGEGQEVDAAAAQLASSLGLKVHMGSVHDACFSGQSYDRIVSNHVLEHVHDPAAMMSRCRDLLTEKGKIVFITPNICSFGRKLFGKNWRGLEPPRHIQIYSPTALRQLLLDCGYSEVSVFTSSARADLVMTGSVDLALRGHHTPSHSRPSLINALATVVLWTAARVSHLLFKDSGEELIAIAQK
jgi:2-polyprenyl-3-methyl-5-hydroxy-6-metoxy-1,4-benzoquinol methylase